MRSAGSWSLKILQGSVNALRCDSISSLEQRWWTRNWQIGACRDRIGPTILLNIPHSHRTKRRSRPHRYFETSIRSATIVHAAKNTFSLRCGQSSEFLHRFNNSGKRHMSEMRVFGPSGFLPRSGPVKASWRRGVKAILSCERLMENFAQLKVRRSVTSRRWWKSVKRQVEKNFVDNNDTNQIYQVQWFMRKVASNLSPGCFPYSPVAVFKSPKWDLWQVKFTDFKFSVATHGFLSWADSIPKTYTNMRETGLEARARSSPRQTICLMATYSPLLSQSSDSTYQMKWYHLTDKMRWLISYRSNCNTKLGGKGRECVGYWRANTVYIYSNGRKFGHVFTSKTFRKNMTPSIDNRSNNGMYDNRWETRGVRQKTSQQGQRKHSTCQTRVGHVALLTQDFSHDLRLYN